MRSVVDARRSLAFAKLELSKATLTAVDTLYDHVLPFYGEQGVPVAHALTDNSRGYCGRESQRFFELFPTLNQVTHRRTEVRSPEINGSCERFHRTVKEEFFAVAFRKTFYESLDQLQADLDRYVDFYNRERAHQGYRTQGRTPYQAFSALLPLEEAA
jgi:transposase InsO family protein